MDDNDILSLEEAARLVHATPETLLQYIRRGELAAARVGKKIIIMYSDLVAFLRMLAAQQKAARQTKDAEQKLDADLCAAGNSAAPPTLLVQFHTRAAGNKRKGRRRPVPPLPPGPS
jgi:excisionase family DNA binding protein